MKIRFQEFWCSLRGLLSYALVMVMIMPCAAYAADNIDQYKHPDTYLSFSGGNVSLRLSDATPSSSVRTKGSFNLNTIGIGHFILPNFLLGVVFVRTDGHYDSTFDVIFTSTLSGTTFSNTHIVSNGFQPYLVLFFPKFLSFNMSVDMSGNYNWVDTHFDNNSVTNAVVNTPVSGHFSGSSWNFTTGLNFAAPFSRTRDRCSLIMRVGYLLVGAQQDSFILVDSNAPSPVEKPSQTAQRSSIMGSMTLHLTIKKIPWLHLSVGFDALYDVSQEPDQPIITDQGFVPAGNVNDGRYQYDARAGMRVAFGRNVSLKFTYLYITRKILHQNAYLLNLNLGLHGT